MTSIERDQLLNHLSDGRDRMRNSLQGLSTQQLSCKPAPSRWSVAEILEHVTTGEARLVERLKTILEQAPDFETTSVWAGREDELVAATLDRSEPLQAPEALQPQNRLPAAESLARFEEARLRTMEFAASTQGDLRHHFFPHPIFGILDSYQWLLAVAAHSERHRAQCEETLSAIGALGDAVGGR